MNRKIALFAVIIVFIFSGSVKSSAQSEEKVSLEDCIRIALKNNTDIVAAKSNAKIYKSSLISAWGNFLPSISATGQWRTRSEELIMFRYKDFVQSKDSYYYDVNASLPLFTGFSNIGTLKKSKAEARMFDHYLTGTEQEVVLQVKSKYYNVIKTKELLKVAEETLKASEEELTRIETMQRIGSVSRAEVFQQKVRVGENKLALIEAQNALANAKTELNFTLGIDVKRKLVPEQESLEFQKVEYDFDELVEGALKNRVDYLAAKDNVESARADIIINRSSYMPRVSLNANYNWFDIRFPDSKKDLDEFDSYSVSLNLSYSLFDGFSRESNLNRAKASMVSSQAELEQAKRQVIMDVTIALQDLNMAEQNIKVTDENLVASEEDYRLARERYSIGAGTLLEQITAGISLARSKANRIQALYDYKYTLNALELAVGKLRVVY
ncbi:MAG: TolC family protein [candidate division KSB1 bacterium]|jgi:outer membrane protein|nr:TolC family protein [candidate division KSB1 bacterium]